MNVEILNAAKSGNTEAINQLIGSVQGYVWSIASGQINGKLRTKYGMEDVVQDVLLKVATDVVSCKAEDWQAFLGWVASVTRNVCYNTAKHMKASKRKTTMADALGEQDVACGNDSDSLVIGEAMESLMKLAEGMGTRTSSVVGLLVRGMESREIATELGVEIGTVYNTVKRFKESARVELASFAQ